MNFNSFSDLAEYGVLDEASAIKSVPATGLRNRLVHEYETINGPIVFTSINKAIEQYTLYERKKYQK